MRDRDAQTRPMRSPLVTDLLRGGRELRPAQVEMALQVQRALVEGVPAVIEAPTGVGKSMAYLVPAIRSGKVVVVSTANKALQEQLYTKDIPFLQEHLQPFGAALLKGVGNYLCLDRLDEARKDGRTCDRFGEFEALLDVVKRDGTFGGDLEKLGFVLPPELRARINGDHEQCAWSKCDWFSHCYIRAMRERAKNAKVIITNHTLLLLDALADHAILPPYDVLVVDEAHHLSEEARRTFTVEIRPTQVTSLLLVRTVKAFTPEALYNEVVQLAAQLWSRLEQTSCGNAKQVTFQQPVQEGLHLATKLADVVTALRRQRPPTHNEKEAVLYEKVITRTLNLAAHVRLVFAAGTSGAFVHYVERVQTTSQHLPQIHASAAPLDVAPFLKEKLFDTKDCIILTSATLATGGSKPGLPQARGKTTFAYFRTQIGLDVTKRPAVIESVLSHAFDYQKQALLYVPRDMPEPAYVGGAALFYVQAIAERMRQLLLASRGRAFLLFSSRHMLDDVYGRLAPTLPFLALRQGEVNHRALLTRFREEGAVLFGLKTFWEGVDIAGEALSLVVIDKLPFGVPADPIHEAIVNRMKARGEPWFGDYVLPHVVLQLKQGVGRLLRTREDRGVMAILDVRLHTKGYGSTVLGALPPAPRTEQLTVVQRFFEHA